MYTYLYKKKNAVQMSDVYGEMIVLQKCASLALPRLPVQIINKIWSTCTQL